ncbi:MAG TPA: hypothetical protein VMT82_06710 [candidate division Zixibacteria bacterium]|nr:hypothetical protein [candidate division Zixibacteria bacterium]
MKGMKRLFFSVLLVGLLAAQGFGAALGTNARSVIPAQVQQIISVDYRSLKNSESGMALKARVLPPDLKSFEQALKDMKIDPDKDVGQLTFVAFRNAKGNVEQVGIAQGEFNPKAFYQRMKTRGVKPEKYRLSYLYPTESGMVVNFLDDNTMLFGNAVPVKHALDARDGEAPSLNSNSDISGLITDADSGAVWSVLDQLGTQNMMHGALGDASGLADYDVVKKRMLGSRYTLDFSHGVNFNLNVLTSDSMTAATMSSLIKAGMLFKKVNASPVEKSAMDSMTVDSDAGRLIVRFEADDAKFKSLLGSDLFAQTLRN